MIKKLRIRFMTVLMSLLAAVMLAVTCAVYVFMYRSEIASADKIMEAAAGFDMAVPAGHEPPVPKPEPDVRLDDIRVPRIDPEEGFSSGWIRVMMDENGVITDVFYSHQRFFADGGSAFVIDDAVRAAAEKINSSDNKKGLITAENIAYRYSVKAQGEKKIIILLDRTNEISTMNRLLLILIGIFALTLVVLFLLSMLLSGWAVVPIEDAWNRQKIFFSNASHELKTPLTVISANLDVITSNADETVDSQKKWFGFIREETDKMRTLINEMLFLSREEQDREPVRAEFNMSEAVEGVCLSMDAVAFEKGRTLQSAIEKDIMYSGERESICRLIHILIDNAVQHSDEGSEIFIKLSKCKGKIKLSVKSQGKNIAPDELEKIFDRYYRTDESRSRDTGGFGLGLAIARAVAENHGGSISAQSDENGTVFTAVL